MAHHASAQKHMRQSLQRRARNRMSTSALKTQIKKLRTAIADEGANIENVDIADHDGLYTAITFTIDVTHRAHLARILRRVRGIRQVTRIFRVRG